MSFDYTKWQRWSSGYDLQNNSQWNYSDQNVTIATLTAAGFFNPVNENPDSPILQDGDVIWIVGSDGSSFYEVTTISPNVELISVVEPVAGVVNHAVLIGEAGGTIGSLLLTDHQLLIGVTGGNPVGTTALPTNITGVTQTPLTSNTTLATTAYTDAAVAVAENLGADKALDNLASVAINTSLLPGADISIDAGGAAKRFSNLYSAAIKTGTTSGNTTVLSARNVGGSSDTPFITLTADTTTPTCALAGAVTGATQTASDNSLKLSTTAYTDNQATTAAALRASKALDNLASVAINTSLLPASDIAIDAGGAAKRFTNLYTTNIKTGTTSGNTTILSARNVGGASDTPFITLTADTTTPTCSLSGSVSGVTQSAANNSTKLATTAYVDSAVATPTAKAFVENSVGTPNITVDQTMLGKVLVNTQTAACTFTLDGTTVTAGFYCYVLNSEGGTSGATITLDPSSHAPFFINVTFTKLTLTGGAMTMIFYDGSSWFAGPSNQFATTNRITANNSVLAMPGILGNTLSNSQTASMATLLNTDILLIPFLIGESGFFMHHVGCIVQTAVAASQCQMGVYDSLGGQVPNKLLLSDTVATTTTGLKTVSIPERLQPGIYYAAVQCNTATTLAISTCNVNFNDVAPGLSISGTTISQTMYSMHVAYSFPFPSTASGLVTNLVTQIPLLIGQ